MLHSLEWTRLLERAEVAYARARELVYDVESDRTGDHLTTEQLVVLAELEMAEADVRDYRARDWRRER